MEIRPARLADIPALVSLFDESSGGVLRAVWREQVVGSESIEDVAHRVLSGHGESMCIANTVIATSDGQRLGAMCCYCEYPAAQHPDEPSSLPAALNQALLPYRELVVEGSLFIAELCCTPLARGQGVGTRLLHYAVEWSESQGLAGVSLRVFSQNTGARRLYTRFGFDVIDKRPVVAYPGIDVAGEVLLMRYPN